MLSSSYFQIAAFTLKNSVRALDGDTRPKGFYGPLEPPLIPLVIGIIGLLVCVFILGYLSIRIINTVGSRIIKYFHDRREILSIKSKYLSVLASIEQHHSEDNMSENEVLFEISRAIRNYSSEKVGDNLTVLTYFEMRKRNVPLASQALGNLYFSEFSNRQNDPNPMPIEEALKIARGLIGGW